MATHDRPLERTSSSDQLNPVLGVDAIATAVACPIAIDRVSLLARVADADGDVAAAEHALSTTPLQHASVMADMARTVCLGHIGPIRLA
jgi:hypothetical protein